MNNSLWNLKVKFYRSIRNYFPLNQILNCENQKLEFLLNSLETKQKKVLDIGTGTGNVLQFFADADCLIGIDITLPMLKAAMQIHPGSKLIQADALNVPVKPDSVEFITAVGLSEYLKDIDLFFKEAHRILRNGGYFLLTFSPSGLWSGLRFLLGHRIYPRSLEEIVTFASNKQFLLIKSIRSLMQVQVLFQKI